MVISFRNGNNDPIRDCFDKYYMPLVEIKNFNALIGNKPIFDQPVTNEQEAYEKPIEMAKKLWLYNRKFIRIFESSKLL